MNTPSPRLRIGQEKRPITQGQIATRVILFLLALTNPIAAATMTLTALLAGTMRNKIWGRHVLLVGIIAVPGGLLVKWSRAYVQPWKEIASFIQTEIIQPISAGTLDDVPSFGSFFGDRISGWLTGQIPFGICLGILSAGIWLTWRDRYRKTWQKEKARKPANRRAIQRAKAAMDKKLEKAPPALTPNDLMLPLGVDTTKAKPVAVAAKSFRTHAVVIGPTGLGKTEVLKRIIWAMSAQPAARDLRIPAIAVDMKGDPALAAWMETTARDLGRPFYKITTDPATATTGYLALAGRRPDEIADMVYEMTFAGDTTLNQHYATLSRRLLQVASHALVDLAAGGARNAHAGRPWLTSLPDLTTLLSLRELRLAMADTSAAVAKRITRYLADVEAAGNEDEVGDVRDRMAIITDTAMGDILAQPGLDLRDAIQQGAFVCFSLDAAASPETARAMGRLAVQDVSATFGALAGTSWAREGLCPIVLDEFSALASPKVADLFARVRSAGGAVILSTQDLDGDLTAVSPQFAATVRTNANVWVVLRQTRGELAESIAGDIGTASAWKETVQIEDDWDLLGGMHAASGVGSLREVDEYIIHPNAIRNLAQGAAILMVKVPAGSLHRDTAATEIRRFHVSQAPTLSIGHAEPPLGTAVRVAPAPTVPKQPPPPTVRATTVSQDPGFDFDNSLAGDDDDDTMPVPSPPDDE